MIMKKNLYIIVMAIIGLSVLSACKDDESDSIKLDFERLVNPETVYHAGAEFEQFRTNYNVRFSLSEKEFLGRSYFQINIRPRHYDNIMLNTPTEMLFRVDGSVIWGYDHQSESEFKMYDFSKWPLEEGDSLIYRIYKINDYYEITGIVDYSTVLKNSSTEPFDFVFSEEQESESAADSYDDKMYKSDNNYNDIWNSYRGDGYISNHKDNIHKNSKIEHLYEPNFWNNNKGLYTYQIWCGYNVYEEQLDVYRYRKFTYLLNFGMSTGKGLFFKDNILGNEPVIVKIRKQVIDSVTDEIYDDNISCS